MRVLVFWCLDWCVSDTRHRFMKMESWDANVVNLYTWKNSSATAVRWIRKIKYYKIYLMLPSISINARVLFSMTQMIISIFRHKALHLARTVIIHHLNFNFHSFTVSHCASGPPTPLCRSTWIFVISSKVQLIATLSHKREGKLNIFNTIIAQKH